MNVHLGETFDKFVADLIANGLYQSQSEVIREGLRLLKEREDLRQIRLQELRQEIQKGIKERLFDGTECYFIPKFSITSYPISFPQVWRFLIIPFATRVLTARFTEDGSHSKTRAIATGVIGEKSPGSLR